jgi:apolipoprotein N-acyltransferase
MKYYFPLSAQVEGTRYVLEGWPMLAAALLGLFAVVVLALVLRRAFDLRTSAGTALGGALFAACVGLGWLGPSSHGNGQMAAYAVTYVFLLPLFVAHTAVVLGFQPASRGSW